MPQFLFSAFFVLFALTLSTANAAPPEFEEYGKAGYYADKLHGRKTASGKAYDKNAMTCSHKSLPFGTRVKVTRLDNGDYVVVTVNDRGPFAAGYVVDLSRRAANELNFIKAGHAQVKVELVNDDAGAEEEVKPLPESSDSFSPEDNPKTDAKPKIKVLKAAVPSSSAASTIERPAEYSTATRPSSTKSSSPKLLTPKGSESPKGEAKTVTEPEQAATAPPPGKHSLYKVDITETVRKGVFVQVGTLYDADNVLPILRKLRKDWPGKVVVDVEQGDNPELITYRVMVGPFGNRKTADVAQKSAKRKGYKECFVVELGNE